LQTTVFKQTPSLVPLSYTANNHQGLNGGYLTTVISDSAQRSPSLGTVYTTDSSTTGPVKCEDVESRHSGLAQVTPFLFHTNGPGACAGVVCGSA
jgi:hypothetical protein